MDIQLNFINQSNDTNNAQIVIFQRNVTAGHNELAVAWKVIQNCGAGDNHPFIYPMKMQVAASDSYGNFTPQHDACPGDAFTVTAGDSGGLARSGVASHPGEVHVVNGLPQGVINANIYKDNRLLAANTAVAEGQTAAFRFQPTIRIGVVAQAEQGEVMDSAVVAQVNTELSLLGIASADIVMTGGGSGPNAQPFRFSFQNIVLA